MNQQRTTLVFHQLPIRIGRDPTSECHLEFPFVSRAHARLEMQGGALMLCDEGSAHGVYLREGTERVPPHGCIQLADKGAEFRVGLVSIEVDLERDVHDSDGGSSDETIDVNGDTDRDGDVTRSYAREHVAPEDIELHAFVEQIQDKVEHQRHAWLELRHELLTFVKALSKPQRAAVLSTVVRSCPWIVEDGSVRELAREVGVGEESAFVPQAPAEASTALRGLRELAWKYTPSAPPLRDAAMVADFTARLDLVLTTLFDGMSALRAAHSEAADDAREAKHPVDRLELGAFALDRAHDGADVGRALDIIVSTALAQRTQLIDETAACFRELAPEAIEASSNRFVAGPFRYKALWTRFCERYRALLGGEDRKSPVPVACSAPIRAFEPSFAPDALAPNASLA